MTEYVCKRCGYTTKVKCNLKNHLSRVNVCCVKEGLNDISCEDLLKELQVAVKEDIICNNCGKNFAFRSGKSRHLKTCKQDNAVVHTLKNRIKELEKLLGARPNVVNNIYNVVIINTFGYENTDYLESELMKDCLKERNLSRLVEQIHFNPEHPENHNLRIKNKKEKLMEYWEEGRWIVDNSEKVLHECIFNSGFRVLKTFYKKNKTELYNEIKEENDYIEDIRIRQQLEHWLQKIENEDPVLYKKLSKDMFVHFITNKAMVYGRS